MVQYLHFGILKFQLKNEEYDSYQFFSDTVHSNLASRRVETHRAEIRSATQDGAPSS